MFLNGSEPKFWENRAIKEAISPRALETVGTRGYHSVLQYLSLSSSQLTFQKSPVCSSITLSSHCVESVWKKYKVFKSIAFPTYSPGHSKCGRLHQKNDSSFLLYPQHSKELFFVLLGADTAESFPRQLCVHKNRI